jgi:hypothetical protein
MMVQARSSAGSVFNGNSRMMCGVLARHSSRNHEEVRASSSGVWEIALPGDALQIPGMNAGARRAFWSWKVDLIGPGRVRRERITATIHGRNLPAQKQGKGTWTTRLEWEVGYSTVMVFDAVST